MSYLTVSIPPTKGVKSHLPDPEGAVGKVKFHAAKESCSVSSVQLDLRPMALAHHHTPQLRYPMGRPAIILLSTWYNFARVNSAVSNVPYGNAVSPAGFGTLATL